MASNFYAAHVAWNQHGQSIIQVLVSIALMGILMTVFASMLLSQERETKALSQKLASTDLERLLQSSLSDGSVCQYIVNNPAVLTFDSTHVSPTTPQIITPTLPIYASVQSGPPVVTGPVVAQIGQLGPIDHDFRLRLPAAIHLKSRERHLSPRVNVTLGVDHLTELRLTNLP